MKNVTQNFTEGLFSMILTKIYKDNRGDVLASVPQRVIYVNTSTSSNHQDLVETTVTPNFKFSSVNVAKATKTLVLP